MEAVPGTDKPIQLMKNRLLFWGILGALATALPTLHAQPADVREDAAVAPALDAPKPAATDGPVIKLALLLDTSNSMDGLINQARTRLWQVVNELGKARVEGALPQLQVALFQYGNSGLAESAGFIQLRCPFTTDLDVVSEQLFSLSTNGGSEYCGAVIQQAMERLDWGQSTEAPVLRVIVIAGNEPFNQGTQPYRESIATARGLGVRVNTVFCGNRVEGTRTLWADGAQLGQGHYSAIDQNQAIDEIETPFDDALRRLNETLNGTYLGYGARGREGAERQLLQDSYNYGSSSSGGLSRVQAKASANYATSSWDLVSAYEEGKVDLEKIDADALPAPMQANTAEENAAILGGLAEERAAVAAEIRELAEKRSRFLAEARKDAATGGPALDDALLAALRRQATELGFVFEE